MKQLLIFMLSYEGDSIRICFQGENRVLINEIYEIQVYSKITNNEELLEWIEFQKKQYKFTFPTIFLLEECLV